MCFFDYTNDYILYTPNPARFHLDVWNTQHHVTTTATINDSCHVTAVAGLDYDDEGSGYKGSRHAGRYVFLFLCLFRIYLFFIY
jgi:hypothetical protein